MDLIDSIRIFKTVAETRSFSRTAKCLGLSQPTVSKAICALEERLAVSLVRRSTRGVNLTPEGERLLHSGSPVLDQIDFMLASVKSESFQLQGQLRIFSSPAFARLVLTPLLGDFQELQPHLRVHFILSDSFIDPVENNLDVSIRVGDSFEKSLTKTRVGCVTRLLYASQKYLDVHGLPENLEDLHKHRLLHYTRFTDPPSWLLRRAGGELHHFHFEPYFQTDNSDLLREATIQGMGIALLPTWMVMEGQAHLGLKTLLPDLIHSSSPVFALTSKANQLSARQRVFIDFIASKFQTMVELSEEIPK